LRVEGVWLGLRVEGWGVGFRVLGAGLSFYGLQFTDQGSPSGFRVNWRSGFRVVVKGSRFRVQGSGNRDLP